MPAKYNLRRRIYGVMTATLQSCRPKHPSDLPINPLPSFPTPLINRRAAAAPIPKRHVVPEISSPRRKICSSPEDDENRNRVRASISSADTGWFSSGGGGGGGDEESEALFSTDSSTKRPPHARRIRRRRRVFRLTKRRRLTGSNEVPARLSAFDELIACAVEGKVKDSFAVVKRSQDPYEDFKESMMEMILEKQMFDRKDLEQLLECFLSLNSRRYHGIIVLAFSQIWEALFSPAARPPVAT